MLRSLVLLTLALALSGCANYVWQQPGVPADVAMNDLAECRRQGQLARLEAELATWHWGADWWGWPGPWGAGWWTWPYAAHAGPLRSPPLGWRLDFERRVADRCMEAKGYQLVKEPRA